MIDISLETRFYGIHHRRYYAPVCDEWNGEQGFENFSKWALENGYKPNLVIDRIDTRKGYSPDNCRWITPTENTRNRIDSLYVNWKNDTISFADLCKIYGIKYSVAYGRYRNGWELEKIFTTPVKPKICGKKHGKANRKDTQKHERFNRNDRMSYEDIYKKHLFNRSTNSLTY